MTFQRSPLILRLLPTRVLALAALLLLLAAPLLLTAEGQQEPGELEPVEIEWWIIPWRIRVPGMPADQAPEGTEFIEWASKTFMEKHPNVTVKGVMVSNKEFSQKTMAAIAAEELGRSVGMRLQGATAAVEGAPGGPELCGDGAGGGGGGGAGAGVVSGYAAGGELGQL